MTMLDLGGAVTHERLPCAAGELEVLSEAVWGQSCLECGADLSDHADPDDLDRCTQCGPGQASAS